jgi:hypothetical protein
MYTESGPSTLGHSSEGGIDCSHSIDDVIFIGIILLRDDENLSHMMNTRNFYVI